MEILGINEWEMWQQVMIALLIISTLLYTLAPLGGRILFALLGKVTPDQLPVVQIGIGIIIYLLSFAITLGALLRWGPAMKMGLPLSLGVSLFKAAVVTMLTAFVIRATLRPSERIESEKLGFGVWDEDARTRRKNLRRR